MNQRLVSGLIERIQAAFAATPYPGDKRIGDDSEVDNFIGKRWQDISPKDLGTVTYLHFFTKEGIRYYVPAYMTAVLEHPELHFSIREAIIRGLAPIDDPDWKSRNITIHEFFSPEERAVIRVFFESYEELFPFPDIQQLTPIDRELTQKDMRALQVAIEYWQMHT